MRLAELRIANFRSFADETLTLDPYTCIVGPNGAGKSTVLTALNVFFRNNASTVTNMHTLSSEDFHHQDTSRPVKITLTFDNLSTEAQEDFKHYYRQGRLVAFAKAEWSAESNTAEVKQYGSRHVMREFAPFFEKDNSGAKAPELKEAYAAIRESRPDLPQASSKAAMISALREYEEGHPDLCELVEDRDEFYGWSKGANRLARYIQWVYVPAVKDASSEQDEGSKTALGQLLQRTIRAKVDFDTDLKALKDTVEKEYGAIVEKNRSVLDALQGAIETRLKEWATPNARLRLNWHYEPGKTFAINEPLARAELGDDAFIGEVARLGHGMQRAFLVSLLQELAMSDAETSPTLLLGFEEPELYQHPPQAQHLAALLEKMAEEPSGNTQVVITTHCPYFAPGRGLEGVRMLRKSGGQAHSVVRASTFANVEARIAAARGERPKSPTTLMARIQQIMQPSQSELFFAAVAVLVEGIEEVAYIATHLRLGEKWDEFRRLGCHIVVADGKLNLSRLLAVALELEIPAFVIFDSDARTRNQPARTEHEKANACILRLREVTGVAPLPNADFWGENLIMWESDIGEVVRSDFADPVWLAAQDHAKREHGFEQGVHDKNSLLIAATLERLWSESKQSQVLGRLCESILSFARKSRGEGNRAGSTA